jgi:hypothetical protein
MTTNPIRKSLMGVAALGALALGGSAIANAASSGTTTTAATSATPSATAPNGPDPRSGPRPDPTRPGGHRGANGRVEEALPADVAAKVKAAAEAKVSGATVERVETDADHGSPYEAHVRKADGTRLEVLVSKDFAVTAVNTMQHP